MFPELCRRWYACWLNADQRSVVRARRDTHRTTHTSHFYIKTKNFTVTPVCRSPHDQLLMGFKPQSDWNAVAGSLRATWKKTFTNINEPKPKKTRPKPPTAMRHNVTQRTVTSSYWCWSQISLDSKCQRSAGICLQSKSLHHILKAQDNLTAASLCGLDGLHFISVQTSISLMWVHRLINYQMDLILTQKTQTLMSLNNTFNDIWSHLYFYKSASFTCQNMWRTISATNIKGFEPSILQTVGFI